MKWSFKSFSPSAKGLVCDPPSGGESLKQVVGRVGRVLSYFCSACNGVVFVEGVQCGEFVVDDFGGPFYYSVQSV